MTDETPSSVRLDRWLWAARFFKTRSLASAAIAGGKVRVNGDRAKAAKLVRAGDVIEARVGPFEHRVTVRRLSERRGSAALAATLFVEDEESRRLRERHAEQLRVAPAFVYEGKGRPTKRDRRRLDRLKED